MVCGLSLGLQHLGLGLQVQIQELCDVRIKIRFLIYSSWFAVCYIEGDLTLKEGSEPSACHARNEKGLMQENANAETENPDLKIGT